MTDEAPVKGRQRRANVPGGRQAEHKVRTSAEEEGRLRVMAAERGVSVPRLLVESTLRASDGGSVADRRELIGELFALHRLVGNIANNMNQISKKTNATGGPIPESFGPTLDAAKRALVRIDETLDNLAP